MKTVFILGAGFSIPAGAPPQSEIMKKIWNLKGPSKALRRRSSLGKFIQNTLNVDPLTVSLEDIYTPIDRCLSDGIEMRGANESKLGQVRADLEYLISLVINPKPNHSYVSEFANWLIGKASVRAEKATHARFSKEAKDHDPLAVVSLNWDTLLDSALYQGLKERHPRIRSDYDAYGVVDYCCYISSFKESDHRVRAGLWTLGCRGYNVKLLKLHGSLNWLQCPNCQRLYAGFHQTSMIGAFSKIPECRHCKKHGYTVKRRRAMIMPTFLKDLTNFQIKLVWQNAGLEIMEARKLVFVGYSLPAADFEFRQLLSRMVHPDAKIEVYLWGKAATFNAEKKRFKAFFNKHDVKIFGGGAEQFVTKLK